MTRALHHLKERPHTAKVVTATVRLEGLEEAMAGLAAVRGGAKILVDPQG